MKTIYLAGGCFWGVEHFFSLVEGVKKTTVGYANSDIDNPSYDDLKAHRSQAAETVKIDYDEELISLNELLDLFFEIIDPTLTDRQGHDIGHQYRTGIYYTDVDDLSPIQEKLNKVKEENFGLCKTEVLKLVNFYNAEDYHQDYLYKNPHGYCHISLDKFEIAKNYNKGNH